MLEVAKKQVCISVSCMLHTFLKYRDHYTSNIIVAAPMQHCNYYIELSDTYLHLTPTIYTCRPLISQYKILAYKNRFTGNSDMHPVTNIHTRTYAGLRMENHMGWGWGWGKWKGGKLTVAEGGRASPFS